MPLLCLWVCMNTRLCTDFRLFWVNHRLRKFGGLLTTWYSLARRYAYLHALMFKCRGGLTFKLDCDDTWVKGALFNFLSTFDFFFLLNSMKWWRREIEEWGSSWTLNILHFKRHRIHFQLFFSSVLFFIAPLIHPSFFVCLFFSFSFGNSGFAFKIV